ncbi:putative MFS family arabinose efflux permease [Spirosoma lacussanchae]|uniref:MFS transporter n=1 Tax=Spirosoma lacussanchae TaxID=1884249 RepID=UPI001109FFBA|nr:MFS transporter [Spirosoma lacussanchae]
MLQRTIRLYRNAYQGLSPSVWLLAGVMLINRCGTMVLPFLTLYLTQHLHFSVTNAGIIMAVYGVGAFVGTFLGGRLTDRYGFYYVQLISLLSGGVFLLLLQFVTEFYTLCGSVFVFTLLGDTFRPANQAAVAHYAGADTRTRAFSLNRLAINLGWAVGGGLGGWLASVDYSLLFWVDGLTCVAAGIVLGSFLPKPASDQPLPRPTAGSHLPNRPTTGHQPTQSPYRDRLFIGFVVCSALYLMVFMQLFTLVPLFFKQELNLTERTIGSFMALNGLVIVAVEMALVYGLEQRQVPKPRLIGTGVVLGALSYALLSLAGLPGFTGLSVAFSFIMLVTISEMLAIPFMQSFTVERASPATRGQYLALYAMGGAFAQTTSPAFGSLMVTYVGFASHWLIMASIALLSATGFWWFGKQLRIQPARQPIPDKVTG